MNIQERMDSINGVIKNIAEFIQTHEDIKTDFNEYLRTIANYKEDENAEIDIDLQNKNQDYNYSKHNFNIIKGTVIVPVK